jgi:hypothetical protein
LTTARQLKFAVIAFTIAGLGVLGSVFFGYLGPSDESTERTRTSRPFTDISAEEIQGLGPGDDKRYLVGDYVLGLYRPTDENWKDLEKMDGLVYSPEITTYFSELDLFIYWRHTPHCGIVVSHTRKGEDRYDEIWLGGYIDEPHAASYDYAGRSIKDRDFALRGYNQKTANLHSPDFEIRGDGAIRIAHTFSPPF